MTDLFGQLDPVLDEFRQAAPVLRKDDDLLSALVCHAKAARNRDDAIGHVVGQAGDGGIDAYYVDDRTKVAFIFQIKYRQKVTKRESKKDVVTDFTERFHRLVDAPSDDGYLLEQQAGLNANAAVALDATRDAYASGYLINLVFASTGTIPDKVMNAAEEAVETHDRVFFEGIDHRKFPQLLEDYLFGFAPAIPQVRLALGTTPVRVKRSDDLAVTTLITWIGGDALANLYEQHGRRLFDLNIRGFLDGKVSTAIRESVLQDPDAFFYLNNGVTIICEKATVLDETLVLTKPQIVNGQQTTRSLHAASTVDSANVASARVLLKVVSVARLDTEDSAFMDTVFAIVQGANNQNAISPRDLISNDTRQIVLGRELEALGYVFVRKKMAPKELAAKYAGDARPRIKLDDVIRTLGSTEVENYIGSIGPSATIERTNKKDSYNRMFREEITGLTIAIRHHLTDLISRTIRKRPKDSLKPHNKAKWPMLYVAWNDLSKQLDNDVSVLSSLKKIDIRNPSTEFDKALVGYINELARQIDAYRRDYERQSSEPAELSPWLNKQFSHKDFESWQRKNSFRGTKWRKRIADRMKDVRTTAP